MRILGIDIETRPLVAYRWGMFDKSPVSLPMLAETTGVLCFGAQWFGERKVRFHSVWGDGYPDMAEAAWCLLSEADVLVHYNGKRFDVPHLNTLMVQAGLKPPEPFKQIDLYSVVRKQFKFDSNKLAHVAPLLGLEGKVSHPGFSMWIGAMNGVAKAQRDMERYCKQDVRLLQQLYDRLQPWIPSHPNRALYGGAPAGSCPSCGSSQLERRGATRTQVSKYPLWRCVECGALSRSSKRTGSTDVQPVSG